MGIGRKVGAFLGLVPEEHQSYAEEDGYPDQADRGEDYDAHGAQPYRPNSPRGDGYGADSYAEDEHGYPDQPPSYEPLPRGRGGYGGNRGFASEPVVQGALAVKPAPSIRRDTDAGTSRPATVKLTGFGEARVIGEKYRDGQSVILDMTEMGDSDARRLVDFSAGLAFSLRGSIEKVAPKVFMLLPPNAETNAGLLEDARAYAGR